MTDGGFLDVSGVVKRFGDTIALGGVDLAVDEGETLVLLGPSGCGKTTLLRVVAGLDDPDAGTVTVDGSVLTGPGRFVGPERRRIGMVFQDAALFGHLTVLGNVRYGLSRNDVRSGRDREALEMVDLAHLADRRPHELSGGQAQRVALARALAPRPRILLFDEPFTGLDASLRHRVRDDVVALLAQVGVTSVIVTHDQEEAFVLGDRIAVLRDGAVRQVGTPSQLYARPADPWVARFVGEANLLSGESAGGVARTVLGEVPLERPVDGPTSVLVRPEDVLVAPGGAGTVTGVSFYGHDCSYDVAVDGHRVRVRAPGAPTVQRGQRVDVRYVGPAAVGYPEADGLPVPPAGSEAGHLAPVAAR